MILVYRQLYLSSVDSEMSFGSYLSRSACSIHAIYPQSAQKLRETTQRSASRRHASLLAFARRCAPSNAATRQPGLRPVSTHMKQLSITLRMLYTRYLSSVGSEVTQNVPTHCLSPTRLPARICASLRSFKCGDSAARPAAC